MTTNDYLIATHVLADLKNRETAIRTNLNDVVSQITSQYTLIAKLKAEIDPYPPGTVITFVGFTVIAFKTRTGGWFYLTGADSGRHTTYARMMVAMKHWWLYKEVHEGLISSR